MFSEKNPSRRLQILVVSIATGTLLCVPKTQAAPEFQIFRVPLNISDMDTVDDIVGDTNTDPEVNIQANLDEALCGGWDYTQEITGKIATTTGLPGRAMAGDPASQVDLGMARKAPPFLFPGNTEETCGFITACRPAEWSSGGTGRDRPPFFAANDLQHTCDRPLDGIRADDYKDPNMPGDLAGKIDAEDIDPAKCVLAREYQGEVTLNGETKDAPEPYVCYSCGGGNMSNVADDAGGFCAELKANNPPYGGAQDRPSGPEDMGQTEESMQYYSDPDTSLGSNEAGGVCQKLNEDWIYTLWRAKKYECVQLADEMDADGNISAAKCQRDTSNCVVIHVGWAYKKGQGRKFNGDNFPPKSVDAAGTPVFDNKGHDIVWEPDPYTPYRYACSDAHYPSGATVIGTIPNADTGPPGDPAPENQWKNCKTCFGSECREGVRNSGLLPLIWVWYTTDGTEYPVEIDGTPVCPATSRYPQAGSAKYYSLFRHYIGSYERDRVDNTDNVTPTKLDDLGNEDDFDDAERQNIPVACYGIWKWDSSRGDLGECDDPSNPLYCLDPEIRQVSRRYFRCVIAAYYEKSDPRGDKHFYLNDEADPDQMEITQAGRGVWKQENPYQDPPIEDPDRTNDEIWMRDLTRTFSLLDSEKLKEDYDNDLTIPLMSTDLAFQRSTVQLEIDTNPSDTINKELSSGALVREFDDTIADSNQQRTIINWWHEVETRMNLYFTPPVARITLPPAWSVDLNPLQPILTPDLPDTTSPTWQANPLMQPIDVQLEVREDLLGEVAKYLEEAILLEYQPEIIPVLVPSGSAVEYRAVAQGWCHWWMWQHVANEPTSDGVPNCDGAQGTDVGDLIDQLHLYADTIDQARELRAESSKLFAEYLKLHVELQENIGQWVIDNTSRYLAYQDEWKKRQAEKTKWEAVQRSFRAFHDKSNMPWCMDQRFTLPVYSLLDPWFPTSTGGSGARRRPLDGGHLPNIDEIKPMPDVSFDFTNIRLSSGAIRMPVLRPVEVRIDEAIIRPPEQGCSDACEDMAAEALDKLPAVLPPLHAYEDRILDNVPKIAVGNIGPGNLDDVLDSIDLPTVAAKLDETRNIIARMNYYYKIFWGSLQNDPEDIIDGTEEDCYLPRGVNCPGCADDVLRYTKRCVHVEQDLIERFVRIGSRPAIYLKEDFASLGQFRDPIKNGYYECLSRGQETKDWACLLFNPENTFPREGWKIAAPQEKDQDEFVDTLRSDSFNDTLYDETGGSTSSTGSGPKEFPYIIERTNILPSFFIPQNTVIHIKGGNLLP